MNPATFTMNDIQYNIEFNDEKELYLHTIDLKTECEYKAAFGTKNFEGHSIIRDVNIFHKMLCDILSRNSKDNLIMTTRIEDETFFLVMNIDAVYMTDEFEAVLVKIDDNMTTDKVKRIIDRKQNEFENKLQSLKDELEACEYHHVADMVELGNKLTSQIDVVANREIFNTGDLSYRIDQMNNEVRLITFMKNGTQIVSGIYSDENVLRIVKVGTKFIDGRGYTYERFDFSMFKNFKNLRHLTIENMNEFDCGFIASNVPLEELIFIDVPSIQQMNRIPQTVHDISFIFRNRQSEIEWLSHSREILSNLTNHANIHSITLPQHATIPSNIIREDLTIHFTDIVQTYTSTGSIVVDCGAGVNTSDTGALFVNGGVGISQPFVAQGRVHTSNLEMP